MGAAGAAFCKCGQSPEPRCHVRESPWPTDSKTASGKRAARARRGLGVSPGVPRAAGRARWGSRACSMVRFEVIPRGRDAAAETVMFQEGPTENRVPLRLFPQGPVEFQENPNRIPLRCQGSPIGGKQGPESEILKSSGENPKSFAAEAFRMRRSSLASHA